MKQAVVEFQGHQYLLSEGQKLEVDYFPAQKGEEIKLERVLLFLGDKGELKIGTPFLKKGKVEAEVLKHFKGKKITVRRYRAKSRYRKTKGFRPKLTQIKIKKINYG